jgi:type II secretory pathway component PulF
MAVFSYKAVNAQGKFAEGSLECESARAAGFRLQDMGLIPISLKEPAVPVKSLLQRLPSVGSSAKDILFFTEELSTLVSAGLPLDRSLSIAAELTSKPALRIVIGDVLKQIKAGKPLADAMAAHPKEFSRLYVNMIRAGEAGGVLDAILKRLVEFARAADELRSHLIAALSIGILFYFVVPKFAAIFEDAGAAMPPATVALLAVSAFTISYWWLVVAAAGAGLFVFRRWVRTAAGSRTWDTAKLRLPLLGAILLKVEVARFARTLGTLTASSVPLIAGVRIVQDIAHNQILAEGIARIATGAKRGEGVAKPMRDAGIFPALAVHLVEVGEETGRLDQMLLQVADIYDKDVRTSLKALTSVVEPVIILVMGVVVGAVVLSILTAIFSINEIGL